jgi:hypothetical protein
MGADVLVEADRVHAQLNDLGVIPAEAHEDNTPRTRRYLQCSCRHSRDAHRHYRPGSDCAVCTCSRWSPRNPLLWLIAGWHDRAR